MNRFFRLSGLILLSALIIACPSPVDDGFGGGGGGGGGGSGGGDTTPPTMASGYPTTLVGSTKILVVAKINEAGKLYGIAVANGSTAPTNAQVKAGTNYGTVTVVGTGSLLNVAANTEVLFTITGLSTGTNYDVYIVAEDNAGNLSSVSNQLNKTTQNTPDTTTPSLSTYSFSNTKTSITFTGTLNEDAYVWALLLADNAAAPNVNQVKGSAAYSGFIARTQKQTSTSLNLQFTGLTEATPYDLYLIFTDAEGNETTTPTKYDVETQAPIVRLVSVAPVYGTPLPYWADGNEGWIDIQILNAAAFNALSDWAVVFAYYNHQRRVYMKKLDLPGSWTIVNNDIIRIHGKNWTGSTDTIKTQNNTNLWDYKTTSTQDLLDTKYGYVYISNSSTIDGTEGVIDLMTYQNAQETQSHWVSNGTSNNAKNLDFLNAQVPTHWNSGVRSGAVTLSDKLTQYLRLKSTVTGDGQSASDWEAYSPGIVLSDASLTPNSIQAGYSGTPSVTISVKILTYGGVTLNTKTADASSISTGSNNVSLTGPDANNFYTATVNLDNGKSVGTYNVVINATGTPSSSASLSIPFNVSPAPILAFTNADFEGTFANSFTTVSSSTGPGWHFRTDTFQQGSKSLGFKATLNNSGSSPSTIDIGITNPGTNFYSNAGYTYLTFWFKGTVSGDNPALRIQVASGGNVPNYYDLNGIEENQVNMLTVKSGGTFPTTPISITNWTKVRLNLTGVNWTPGSDASSHQFKIRIRRGSSSQVPTDHDWAIDHIQFEN